MVVGASGRSAAMSCLRAGLVPIVCDFFCDQDTRDIADVKQIPSYESLLKPGSLPDCDFVLFTGATEHHRRVVEHCLLKSKPIGNPTSGALGLANPIELFQWAESVGVPMPKTQLSLPKGEGRWLKKRFKSSGGLGVHTLNLGEGEFDESSTSTERMFFQKFVDGNAMSAVFCANGGKATLCGCTKQLTGLSVLGASDFKYCGSIGPVDLSSSFTYQLLTTASGMARDFKLSGLFGIDFVFDHETAWMIEVNPRYTASVEVLELHAGQSLIKGRNVEPRKQNLMIGKAIIYWPEERPLVWNNTGNWARLCDIFQNDDCIEIIESKTVVADVPQPDTEIKQGHPVLTVFAAGATTEQCESILLKRGGQILDQLLVSRPTFRFD